MLIYGKRISGLFTTYIYVIKIAIVGKFLLDDILGLQGSLCLCWSI